MLEKNSIISYFAWIRAKRVKVEKYNKCFLGEFEIKDALHPRKIAPEPKNRENVSINAI